MRLVLPQEPCPQKAMLRRWPTDTELLMTVHLSPLRFEPLRRLFRPSRMKCRRAAPEARVCLATINFLPLVV